MVAVFTGADLDVGPMPPVLPRFDPALSLPLLAGDVVRYVGEPVAVVVAENAAAAADAADLVVVEYDALPDDTPLFDHLSDDIAETYAVGDDAEGLFDGCDVVVSLALTHPRMAACPLENTSGRVGLGHRRPSAPLAQRAGSARGEDGPAGGLRPRAHHGARDRARRRRRIRPKFGNYPEDVVTAWVARRIGRPARWIETRSESMVAMHHGRAQTQTVTLGGTARR